MFSIILTRSLSIKIWKNWSCFTLCFLLIFNLKPCPIIWSSVQVSILIKSQSSFITEKGRKENGDPQIFVFLCSSFLLVNYMLPPLRNHSKLKKGRKENGCHWLMARIYTPTRTNSIDDLELRFLCFQVNVQIGACVQFKFKTKNWECLWST